MDLKEARILIVGATGAGAAVAGHLAAAGAGYVAVADGGRVEPADLGLALLHYAPDVASNRAESLAAKLGFLNPDVQADPYPVSIDQANTAAIVTGHDVVVDATGDRTTSELLVRACVELAAPLVHVEVSGAAGTVLVTSPGRTACLACVPGPLAAAPAGDRAATGALAGMLGAAAAADVSALVSEGPPERAIRRIAGLPPEIRAETVDRDAACAVCGTAAPAPAAAAQR